jgi:tetratricopeptide (TPR) repeat protein
MRSAALLLLICWALLGLPVQASAGTFLVLPFFNLTGDTKLDWIGESLCVAIRETLAAEGLLVYEREDRNEAFRRLSIRPYTQLTTASVLRLGEVLDADAVIYGQFELLTSQEASGSSRGTLRMQANIIDISRAERLTKLTELGAFEDLERLQSHLAWQTWRALDPATAPTRGQFEAGRARLPVEAIESYIRGLLAPDLQTKSLLFAQAIKVAPDYSAASFQLGQLDLKSKNYAAAANHLKKVAPEDPHFREALFLRGIAQFQLDEHAEAVRAFETVASTVPLNEVLNNLGIAQMQADPKQAVDTLKRALEGDPADADYHYNLGYALWRSGSYEEAAASFRAALQRRPGDEAATLMLGKSLRPSLPNGPSSVADKSARMPSPVLKQNYDESAYLQLKALVDKP